MASLSPTRMPIGLFWMWPAALHLYKMPSILRYKHAFAPTGVNSTPLIANLRLTWMYQYCILLVLIITLYRRLMTVPQMKVCTEVLIFGTRTLPAPRLWEQGSP